jgi:hypothetical protein
MEANLQTTNDDAHQQVLRRRVCSALNPHGPNNVRLGHSSVRARGCFVQAMAEAVFEAIIFAVRGKMAK